MEITNEMILDILDNLKDDELKLFVEYLVNNNKDAKETLYKYYIGLIKEKYIDKNYYKERLNEEIKVDKIHPYAFVRLYELINNSIQKFDKENNDFLYELIFEAYIQLSLKYLKIDFEDLLDYLNNVNTPLSSQTLEIIIDKILLLKKSKLSLKVDILTKLLKYINKFDLSIYLDAFYTIYELNEDKEIYLALIDYIFIYIQKNYSKKKAINFLEYFVMENYRINHAVVSYYKKDEDYEKALVVLNKTNTSKLKENEYKDYLITKGELYKNLGSNTLYYKSLMDLVLHNHFEYLNILKEEQKERDFISSLNFIIDNLKIKRNSNLSLFHSILRDNISSYGLITFMNYFDLSLIYEDILFFKELDINEASNLYESYILELAKNTDSNPKLNALNEHVLEYITYYNVKDINLFLNKLKQIIKKEYYQYIYTSILNNSK